jgi:hypothetical protein
VISYLRSQNWFLLVTLAVISAALCSLLGDFEIKLPPSMRYVVPFRMLGPIVPAILVALLLTSKGIQAKRLAVRPVLWIDRATFALTVCAPVIAYLASVQTALTPSDLVPLRNYLGLLGLAAISGVLFGRHGQWLLPAAYLFAAMVAGISDQNQPFAWSWVLQPAENPAALAFAGSLLASGLVFRELSNRGR